MSWSLGYKSLADFQNEKPEYPLAPNPTEEVTEQVELARRLATTAIDSGVIGEGKDYRISLAGHANPNHEPVDGWANDMLSINISQLSPHPLAGGRTEGG
jgi:hypothetical protein